MEDLYHLGIKGLIRNFQGEVLLLKVNVKALKKAKDSYWDLPGGRVKKGQTVKDTLRREVEEETGIKEINEVSEVGMVLSNIRIPLTDDSDVGLILAIYECKIDNKTEIKISNEHTEYKWFTPSEAAELLKVKYPESFTNKIKNLGQNIR